jgi:predicted dehydrogenase
MSEERPVAGVGLVGYAFMGKAHSLAWRTVSEVFDPPVLPRLIVLSGRDADQVKSAADRYGWESHSTDWRAVVERDDIDIVDICTPGSSHAEIAIAALEAGKHVLCEKPLANSVAEAEAMAAAAEAAAGRGVRAMVGFNYRRVPALTLAARLVADGRIGEVRQVRAQYLQDWLVDPSSPLNWRLRQETAGSGALGDIGAHIIDLAQFVTGQTITAVSGVLDTFIRERPVAAGSAQVGPVTVDDTALFTARFSNGALGTFTATRLAPGHGNGMGLAVDGTTGSIAFDFPAMNELRFLDGNLPAEEAGTRTITVTDSSHPYLRAWWPAGHVLGYEHTFTHEIYDFLAALGSGIAPAPSFADGLQVQRVLDAVTVSARTDSRMTSVSRG